MVKALVQRIKHRIETNTCNFVSVWGRPCVMPGGYGFRTWVGLSVQSMAHPVTPWPSAQGSLHECFGEYVHSSGGLSCGVFNCTVS